MSRGNSRPQSEAVEPSPAHDSLRRNLDVNEPGTGLTLSKKKSLFGNLRDAVQKGALQAKATVDSIRGEQNKSTQNAERTTKADTEPDEPQRRSVDSSASTAPIIGDMDKGRRSHASKSATVSSRLLLSKHGSKNHHKRSSVDTAPFRTSSDVSNIFDPERFASPDQEESNAANHKRHSSLANSLVGSIRGLGRKKGKGTAQPSKQDEALTARQAEIVPLPSSPIDIPVAAPALELDLGPAAFMPSTFSFPESKRLRKDDVKLTDPANITTGVPKSYHLHVPAEIETKFADNAVSVTPSELLSVPSYFSSNAGNSAAPVPTTPMPGTNLSLEVDGADSDKSDKSNVFERSVTPPTEKEHKALRSMRSLDAMAEACAVAHANDEMEEAADHVEDLHPSSAGPPKNAASPELHFYTPRRDRSSGTTVSSCPSDMEELSRQTPVAPVSWIDGQQDLCMGNLAHEDPFTTSNPTGDNGPSSIRGSSLSLPPNTADELSRQGVTFANEDLQLEDETANYGRMVTPHPDQFTSGPPSPVRSVTLPFRPKARKDNEEAVDSIAENGTLGRNTPPVNEAAVVSTSVLSSFSVQTHPEPNDPVVQESMVEQNPPNIRSAGEVEYIENLASDDDMHTRAQQLLTSDIVLPNYDTIDSPSENGFSPHGPPLVPRLYNCIPARESPISGSVRARTTYTTGIGDAEYKFTFDNWLRGASSPYAGDDEPRTLHRKSMDQSIDSVSTDYERQTPQISPLSSSVDHTPSVGNRLEFDLQRSQRNTRYNALQKDTMNEDEEVEHVEPLPPFRFLLGGADEIDGNAFAFADFENAYASSRAGSPRRHPDVLHRNVSSQEDVTELLKEAASDYSRLEQSLDDMGAESKSTIDFAEIKSRSSSSQSSGKRDWENAGSRVGSSTYKRPEDQTLSAAMKDNTRNACDPVLGIPVTRRSERAFLDRSTEVTRTESSTGSDEALSELLSDELESTAESLSTRKILRVKERVASLDTLDNSLQLFSSPESGYQADRSSVSSPAISKAPSASRYRSLSKRTRAGKPLGDIPHNIV